jgi:predicted transcriptional regulator
MTKNLTLRIDQELLKALRHRANGARMTLSAWITSVLAGTVRRENDLSAVRERAIQRLEKGFHLGGKPVSRESLHAR